MRDKGEFLFTSESVSEGHPDKVADRLSDTVLDAFLAADPYSRVACETLVTTNRVVLAGETRGPDSVTHEYLAHLARDGDQRYRLRAGRLSLAATPRSRCTCTRSRRTSRRASTAPATRTRAPATRASCSATPAARPTTLMPAPLYYAHEILRTHPRPAPQPATRSVAGLLPDAKSQVTLRYVDGKPVGATSVVVSTQHEEGLEQAEIKRMLWPLVESSAARRAGCRRRPNSTSTRPAISSSADRTAIAA